MPALIGFNTDQTIRINTAREWAKQCIDNALDAAFSSNDEFGTRLSKYVSTQSGINSVSTHVMKTISSMKLVIDSDLYKIQLGTQSSAPGSNAEMCSWKQDDPKSVAPILAGTMQYQGKAVNVLEAQMDYAGKNGASAMTIYPLFFNLVFYGVDMQCQVQSFLHELSHCAAGTVDYSVSGLSPYGMSGVHACKAAGRGAHNAENIAMFLASFA